MYSLLSFQHTLRRVNGYMETSIYSSPSRLRSFFSLSICVMASSAPVTASSQATNSSERVSTLVACFCTNVAILLSKASANSMSSLFLDKSASRRGCRVS